jgi:hypothetical protein
MTAELKWVLRDPNVHTTIPAFSNHDELAEDLAVMNDLTMTPAEERDLGIGQAAAQDGLFCQQCGRCVPQCPARLEIPVLMRSYMYWVGHQRPQQARHTLRAWTVADVPCSGCDVCRVRCAMGFDVRRRALDVAQFLSA